MLEPQVTEKTVGAFEVRRHFGRLLQEILARGDKVIVQRHGQPVAAMVPLDVYQQWKQNRTALFDDLRKAQRHADLDPEEADALAREAVQVVRAGNRDEGRH